jgi:hypothetical protein
MLQLAPQIAHSPFLCTPHPFASVRSGYLNMTILGTLWSFLVCVLQRMCTMTIHTLCWYIPYQQIFCNLSFVKILHQNGIKSLDDQPYQSRIHFWGYVFLPAVLSSLLLSWMPESIGALLITISRYLPSVVTSWGPLCYCRPSLPSLSSWRCYWVVAYDSGLQFW